MAGVAPQRGGSNATTVGMIVSICVAVALLGVLIFLFTGQEQLRNNEKKAKDDYAKIAGGSDRESANKFIAASGNPSPTLLGNTVKAANMIVARLTGNSNDSAKEAADKLDAVLAEIQAAAKVPNPDQISQANGAVAILQQMHGWFVAEKAAKETALADLAKATKSLEDALANNKELGEKFDNTTKTLNTTVAELEKSKLELEATKNSDLDALKKTIDEKGGELATVVREKGEMQRKFAAELTKVDEITREQQKALGDAKGPGPEGAQALAVARKPVGRILRALPGDTIVHVDLGKRDRVAIGMTLAVYSPDRRVPETGRGKSNLEIVSVGERTSECRVITPPSPEDPILEGDSVGNILLSRSGTKKQKFCIIGRFDLNYDGQPDVRGLDNIKSFVGRFGGEVTDTVDASTDYLIVGTVPPDSEAGLPLKRPEPKPEPEPAAEEPEADADADKDDADADADADKDDADADKDEDADADEEPAAPAPKAPAKTIAKPGEVDHPLPARTRRHLTERGRYEEAIRRADALMVPRMTQDHFFNFIGIEAGPNVAKRVLD